jgi:hypothetical protein
MLFGRDLENAVERSPGLDPRTFLPVRNVSKHDKVGVANTQSAEKNKQQVISFSARFTDCNWSTMATQIMHISSSRPSFPTLICLNFHSIRFRPLKNRLKRAVIADQFSYRDFVAISTTISRYIVVHGNKGHIANIVSEKNDYCTQNLEVVTPDTDTN